MLEEEEEGEEESTEEEWEEEYGLVHGKHFQGDVQSPP